MTQPGKLRKARRWIALAAAVLTTGGVLSVLTGGTAAQALVSPGATARVSVDDAGRQQETLKDFGYSGAQNPSMSGDGTQVAFDTKFPLDPVDAENDHDAGSSVPAVHESDIYVRSRGTNPDHTVLITRGVPPPIIFFRSTVAAAPINGEVGANGDSTDPSISANGRYVAFRTDATNINTVNETFPSPDAQHTEIVIADRDPDNDGILDEHLNNDPTKPMDYTYTVVSRVDTEIGPDPNPEDPFPGPTLRTNSASQPSLTIGNGFGEVAWVDTVTVGKPAPPARVVVSQFALGPNGQIQPNSLRFATTSPGRVVPGAEGSSEPAISRDGTHVAYAVDYTTGNVEIGFTFGRAIADAEVGNFCENNTFCVNDQVRLDIDHFDAGNPVYLTGFADDPAMTGDGRKVVFTEQDANAAIHLIDRNPDGAGPLWTPLNGEPLPALSIVSRNNAGAVGFGSSPAITPDGRYLAFVTSEPNFHNGFDDTSQNNPCNFSDFAAAVAASSCADVVVRDLTVDDQRGAATPPLPRLKGELASPSLVNDCGAPAGETCENNGFSFQPSLADDGSAVAYGSGASDLVGTPDGPNAKGDSNGLNDIFVREFRPTVQGLPLSFGQIDVGTDAIQTATIQQSGFGPVKVGSAVLAAGANQLGFTLVPGGDTCTGRTLFEGEQCGVTIQYSPRTAANRQTNLIVTPLGPGRTPVPVQINGGFGVPPDGFTANPNPVAFGQHLALTTSNPGATTIGNQGRIPFTITAVTMPAASGLFPGDYTVTADTCVGVRLSANVCGIQVTFTPHGPGTRNAVLQISTVADFTGTRLVHLVSLTGSAPVAQVQVNPGVVASGQVTQVTGQGFAPGRQVVVAIGNFPMTLTPTAAADGSFAVPLIVFPHTTADTHVLSATVAGTTLTASAPMLVVLGSSQPPGFEIRR